MVSSWERTGLVGREEWFRIGSISELDWVEAARWLFFVPGAGDRLGRSIEVERRLWRCVCQDRRGCAVGRVTYSHVSLYSKVQICVVQPFQEERNGTLGPLRFGHPAESGPKASISLARKLKESVDGALTEDDPVGVRDTHEDTLTLSVEEGQLVVIDLFAEGFDAYLRVTLPSGAPHRDDPVRVTIQ